MSRASVEQTEFGNGEARNLEREFFEKKWWGLKLWLALGSRIGEKISGNTEQIRHARGDLATKGHCAA